eukprot:6918591-Pyramimonas_sp.AAC.1
MASLASIRQSSGMPRLSVRATATLQAATRTLPDKAPRSADNTIAYVMVALIQTVSLSRGGQALEDVDGKKR